VSNNTFFNDELLIFYFILFWKRSMGNIMMTPDLYVNIFSVILGGYAVQMLLAPGKLVTDNFVSPATPMAKFWIRGQAPAWAAVSYCVQKLETSDAVQVCTAVSILAALLYPGNAKFDFTGDKLPVNYPFHYLTEGLLAGLSLGGLYVMFA
jgi:hypothetical protein